MQLNRYASVIILIAVSLILSACNKEEKKSSTQVAAKVNGAEISMHQINQVMKTAKGVTPENAAAIRQQILDKLIDQQIIVEKAEKDNLDRTPEVMLAIEAAKKEILARAFLQKMVGSSITVSDSDVNQYYEQHPALFQKRRIYSIQDIGLEKNAETETLLKAEVEKQKSMQEVADWLKTKGVKFSGTAYTRPAEQIPLEVLPQLESLGDGSVSVIDMGNSTHVIKLVKSEDAPISLEAAAPLIRNYITNTKGKQLVESEVKKYRSAAKIEYVGDFNKPVEAPNQPMQSSSKAEKSTMEAGIAGLK